jgi:phosphoribosyl 1,2-cyclic phosphodiesterase
MYIPGNSLRLHGAYDIVTMQGIEQVMNVQLQYSYFPIREAELKAGIDYHNLTVGTAVPIGDASVKPVLMNHPVTDLGYRIECNGKSMFFTGDHEPWLNIYVPGDPEYADYQAMIEQRQAELDAAIGPVDLLIVDTAYTQAEYPNKVGWGHGTYETAIAMAERVRARRLLCTHHEPTRSDDDLEKVFSDAVSRHPVAGLEVLLAREGMEIEL